MNKKHIIAAAIAAVSTVAAQAATITPTSPRPAVGVPYDWFVALGANDSAQLIAHCGAWSWEDNALFNAGAGEPPVGWTHTSKWVGVSLANPMRLTVRLERQENVPWPSGADPLRVADTASMFPSFTLWRGWDTDGTQDHTFDNRGNPSWAEGLSIVTFVDNSTETSVERTYILPAGNYTVDLGSNAPATNTLRQGFKATLTTAPIATAVALSGSAVPGLTGVTYKALYAPAVNDAEQVAFRAQLTGTGVTSADDVAILADIGSTPLAVVARKGQADAATGSTFASFGDPVTDSADNVTFQAKVKQGVTATATSDAGIWRYLAESGTTQIIAREGSVASGATDGAKFKAFTALAADEGGGAYVATLVQDGTLVTRANDDGVWHFDTQGTSVLIAREGQAFEVAPGDSRVVKAISFLNVQSGIRGTGRSTNSTGGRVLLLTFADKTSGIFQIVP